MSIPVTLQPGVLESDCYPADPQTLNENIVNGIVAEMDADFSGFVKSPTAPGVDYQSYMWFNTTDNYWYNFSGGNWIRPHQTPAGGSERRLWVGSESDVWSYDGGDGSDPGVVIPTGATGAMWEVDHNFDGKFILGPGTLASGAAIGVNDTGGEEKHVLLAAELPTLSLTVAVKAGQATGLDNDNSEVLCNPSNTTVGTNPVTLSVPTPGTDTAHNNMPPYKAAFVIKRTGRQYIKA